MILLIFVILAQVSGVFLQQKKLFSLQNLCNRIEVAHSKFFVAEDFSKIKLRRNEFFEVKTSSTSIADYLMVSLNDGIAYRQYSGHRNRTVDFTVDTITGYVQRFNFSLSYHPDMPHYGSMAYVFKEYMFRVTCDVWENQWCFRKCHNIRAMSNGKFLPRYKYESVNHFAGYKKEEGDVYTGFKSSEVYKINKHLGQELLNQINNSGYRSKEMLGY